MSDGEAYPNNVLWRVSELEGARKEEVKARSEVWKALAETNKTIAVMAKDVENGKHEAHEREKRIEKELAELHDEKGARVAEQSRRRFQFFLAFAAPVVSGVIVGAILLLLHAA